MTASHLNCFVAILESELVFYLAYLCRELIVIYPHEDLIAARAAAPAGMPNICAVILAVLWFWVFIYSGLYPPLCDIIAFTVFLFN